MTTLTAPRGRGKSAALGRVWRQRGHGLAADRHRLAWTTSRRSSSSLKGLEALHYDEKTDYEVLNTRPSQADAAARRLSSARQWTHNQTSRPGRVAVRCAPTGPRGARDCR